MRYQKTPAGRDEIRTRSQELPRPARNLLLIIDDTREGAEWVGLVHGATLADLDRLVQAGLVLPKGALTAPDIELGPSSPAAAPAAPTAPAAPGGRSVLQVLEELSYRELYDQLTADARPRLGLIKGYRMVLDIERCTDVEALRTLAIRYINEVRASQGEAAAKEFCRKLGADV